MPAACPTHRRPARRRDLRPQGVGPGRHRHAAGPEVRQIGLAWKADAFATATITVTDIGENDDTVSVLVAGNLLGSYTKTADETDVVAVATELAKALTGYGARAVASGNVITIKMHGATHNAVSPTITPTGSIAATATAFAGGKSETVTDGFSTEIRSAIAAAQAFAEWAYTVDKPCHVVLEGRSFTATPSAAINLRNLTVGAADLDATKVSIVIGQDWNYAEQRLTATPFGIMHKLADVGTFLGTLSAAEMNQSTAEVAAFDLSDAVKAKWLAGALSNHVIVEDQEEELQQLEDYGYIFPISLTGVSGYRWNNDHVCSRIVIDEDGNYNEHMIYYGRTLDECSRALKVKLLARLKSRVSVDSTTGKLSKGIVKNLEGEGNEVFNLYAGKGLLEDGATIIDPNSDLITPPKSLLVSFKVVATPILDNISAKINLVKSIQL